MTTNILQLPIVQFVTDANNNSDLLDLITTFVTSSDDPTPIDLTGISFKAQVRRARDSQLAYLDCQTANHNGSTGNGQLVIDSAGGKLSWNIPWTVIEFVKVGKYVVDILAYGDGHTLLVGDGTFNMIDGVTIP